MVPWHKKKSTLCNQTKFIVKGCSIQNGMFDFPPGSVNIYFEALLQNELKFLLWLGQDGNS